MSSRLLNVVAGFLLALLSTELLLHALPVSTGYRIGAISSGDPIMHGAQHFRYVYSRDWNLQLANAGQLNNYGFRAGYDYLPREDAVALIGNSFIQADAVPPAAAMPAVLGRMLGRPTYGIAFDGFSIADYLAAARWSAHTFDTSLIVVLLTKGDLRNACLPRSGQHYLRLQDARPSLQLIERPSPSSWHRLLDHVMLFRYVYDNLHIGAHTRGRQRRQAEAADTGDAAARDAESGDAGGHCWSQPGALDAMSRYLLDGFDALERTSSARVAFAIAPTQGANASSGPRDIDLFARAASARGFSVVRLDADFAQAVRAGRKLDFLPLDGHWNTAGQALAARAIARGLGSSRDSQSPAARRTLQMASGAIPVRSAPTAFDEAHRSTPAQEPLGLRRR